MVVDAWRGPGPTSGSGDVALYLNALLATSAPLPAIHLLATSAQVNQAWPYPAGEWLLNYRGGLARRGLAGAVVVGAVMTRIVVVGALGRMRAAPGRGWRDAVYALLLVGLALVLGVPETGGGAGGLLRTVVLAIFG